MQENNNLKKPKQFNPAARVRFVFVFALLIAIGFVFRLFYLQILASAEFKENAYAQRRSEIEILPERGNIYDRDNRPLAVSVKVNNCYLSPRQIKEENREETAELLSYILSLDKSDLMTYLQGKKAYIAIKKKLSQEEVKQIKSSGLAGVSIEREAERYYPNNDILAQTLGIVNNEGRGIYGLEAQYDNLLRGSSGRSRSSRDIRGNIIPTESAELYNSVEGENIQLTIDLRAQKIISDQIKKGTNDFQADSCSAILMDPNTGEVLAMDHYPSFNANAPRVALQAENGDKWDDLSPDSQMEMLYERWKNPIISRLYEPGSIFKILTAAISLESASNKPDSIYECKGKMELAPGISISCWRAYEPHGSQTLEEALNHSCNPAFVQVEREMGKNTFYSYLRALSMGGKTGIDLPSETNSSLAKDPSKIDDLQFDTMSYGYGISLTAMEMITAANTVINGGYYRIPHLFKQAGDNQGNLLSSYKDDKSDPIFSKDTVDKMRKYLYSTSVSNNAKVMRVENLKIGSKSGTAHIIEGGNYSNKTMASFYSFYPADEPRYALLVVAENPKTDIFGGIVAGEISARIIEELNKAPEQGETTDQGVTLPDLKGKTVAEATKELENLSLNPSLYGDMTPFSLIGDQDPKAAQILSKGEQVKLLPDENRSIKVPDLQGMPLQDIRALMDRGALKIKIKGEGAVCKEQNPQAGQIVPISQEIIIEMGSEE